MSNEKFFTVTQVKSTAGRLAKHRATVKALGLRRIGHTVQVKDTPETRGMVDSVPHLVRLEGN